MKKMIFCFHRVWPEETKFWRKKCWIFLQQQQSCRSAASRAIENESSIDVQNYSYAANVCRSVCMSVHLASSLTELLSSAVVYVTTDADQKCTSLYRWTFHWYTCTDDHLSVYPPSACLCKIQSLWWRR